jgi:hypothetical protein
MISSGGISPYSTEESIKLVLSAFTQNIRLVRIIRDPVTQQVISASFF